ncbi:nucleotide-binding alpha-beta plait domain-containing protein [Tanacetum coccineum]
MGSFRSKEDEVSKVSTSIFVTNLPDKFIAKDLRNVCKQYGNVVDAFIPNRRSKAGKRFGFVRFIKKIDVEILVNNLCTIWIGRHKLHANVARFQRMPANKGNNYVKDNKGDNRNSTGNVDKEKGVNGQSNSYIHVVKTGSHFVETEEENDPTLVLDESCVNQQDFSLNLLGEVKEFASLSNLKRVLANEDVSKKMFQDNTGVGTWFAQLIQASKEFTVDERVTWEEIEGVPIKMWCENTFNRIASK